MARRKQNPQGAGTDKSVTKEDMSLSDYLLDIRRIKRLSLREVEAATNNEVSNAYLSQLENGHIKKPSPNILHALANVYAVSYEVLMEKAGYITQESGWRARSDQTRVAAFADASLTREEEEELLKYLAFIRSRK